MGWKNVKQHYRIGHIVHVREGNLCIGSPYISELFIVSPTGAFQKVWERLSGNADLERYHAEISATPEKFRELFSSPDTFAESLPVFTCEGATILELRCEAYGWPNITHCGRLMYENTFSRDKAAVVSYAKRNAAAGVKIMMRNIAETELKLQSQRETLAEYTADLEKLNRDYPTP